MAGELIDQALQIEVGGLLMGGDGGWQLTTPLTGLGVPALRTADTPRPLDHGEWPEPTDFMAGRVVTGGLFARSKDPAALQGLADELNAAWAPARDAGMQDVPMAVSLGSGDVFLLFGRPRRCEIDYSRVGVGILTAVWQYKAHDPRRYSMALHTEVVATPVASEGRTYPRTYPMAYGAGTSAVVQVANAGTFETRPVWVIEGPLVNPRLENVTTGQTLTLAIDVADGDTLEIDMLERTVLLNGTASRYSAVTSSADGWWLLGPGTNEIRLGADSGAGTATIMWRDAWL